MADIQELLKASIINLDKPRNQNSHHIAAAIGRMLKVKIGHAGTLDPAVTGVLPIFIGKATRLSQYFLEDKEYEGIMHVHRETGIKKVKEAIRKKFTGKIRQIPPSRSAVKRQEREKEIYSFNIMRIKGGRKAFSFHVHCQSGTYIRKLIHDLGQELEAGAHMQQLRRMRDGILNEKTSVSFEDLKAAVEEWKSGNEKQLAKYLLPIEIITKKMPKLTIRDEFAEKARNGCPIFNYFLKPFKSKLKEGQRVAILSEEKRLVEIAVAKKDKDIIAVPETVIIL
jgi:H/ACA ribonucleoprotein complex subunit 4